MEVQEDHLRGMKHADKLLMFGDGSYGAASSPILKLQPFKLKAPSIVKVPIKSIVRVKLAPVKSSPMAALKPVGKPIRTRVKPMVVLVKPMSSNRMPMGGKGPVDAARPVHIKEWLASMWGGVEVKLSDKSDMLARTPYAQHGKGLASLH